jgi:outer membrane protein assembly factor BamD (BamD/ComL family)
MFAENTPENGTPAVENQETNVDGDSIASGESETITDTKNPEFYLRQIPVTPAGIEKSNQIRAEALYKMAGIYQDQLEDYPLAISTFDEYHTKYPGYESASDAVYFEYLLCVKTNRDAEAEKLRIKLISEFPDSKYAQLLNNPKYLQLKKQMFTEQDSVYRMAYEAFNKNDFQLVNGLVDTMFSKYPLSPLMPRFKFLKALSTGKTGTQEAFENELENLISSYPESEVTSISKDMLALVKQGRETKQGTTHGSILARREEELIQSNDSAGLTFTNEINVPHRLVLIAAIGEKELYPLQFRLAVFNFSKFLLKDFELNIARIGQSGNGLSVFDFENKEEATWYLNTIMEDEEIKQLMKELNVNPLIISENNFMLLGSGLTLDEYLIFAAEKSHQN